MGRHGTRYLEAFEMHLAGKSCAAIATGMGIRRGTVWNLIRYARVNAGKKPDADSIDSWGEGEAHCEKCGLRGEHECIPSSAVAFMGRRGEQNCSSDTGRRK